MVWEPETEEALENATFLSLLPLLITFVFIFAQDLLEGVWLKDSTLCVAPGLTHCRGKTHNHKDRENLRSPLAQRFSGVQTLSKWEVCKMNRW